MQESVPHSVTHTESADVMILALVIKGLLPVIIAGSKPFWLLNIGCLMRKTIRTTQRFAQSLSSLRTAMKASVGTCTVPRFRIFFLPSFCFSSSFFLRVMSPP